ncbi:MAG TPA: YncE family protein [Methylomirabilota bacterium]|nr:YncE family protein [Methylomirabilota bacterium]
MKTPRGVALAAVAVVVVVLVPGAHAQLAVSANDNKVVLVNGTVKTVPNASPDTITLLDLGARPPKVLAEVPAGASVVGPPLSVALTPDEGLALVTVNQKIDPADPSKQTADNRLLVVDLTASPPAVVATLPTGKAPAGLSINRQGTLALVANREEGSVSVFTIQGKTVAPAGTVTLGDAKIGTSHVAITPDGKTALVTRDNDDRISVLSIDGTKVEYTKRDLNAGLRPYGVDVAASGAFATVANIGRGQGDLDTISLIDLKSPHVRVVDTASTGAQSPEGIKVSPDGTLVAVVCQDGSNKPKESPFFNDSGKLVLFRVNGTALSWVATAPVGHWPQGAAFSADGKTIVVGNMVEKELWVFDWNGSTLRDTGQRIKVNGGSAAIRTADK